MSKIALTPNAAGTGIFTIASPNSNTNRTLSLPDETGTIITSASTTGVDASALSTGTVATARLGSGTADSTTYLRGDQTWATVAGGVTSLNGQTGAITNTSLYAIGSNVNGRPQNTTNYAVNSTLAGSSLYSLSDSVSWDGSIWNVAGFGSASSTSARTLVNTGTWRCLSPAALLAGTSVGAGLWVRIS